LQTKNAESFGRKAFGVFLFGPPLREEIVAVRYVLDQVRRYQGGGEIPPRLDHSALLFKQSREEERVE